MAFHVFVLLIDLSSAILYVAVLYSVYAYWTVDDQLATPQL